MSYFDTSINSSKEIVATLSPSATSLPSATDQKLNKNFPSTLSLFNTPPHFNSVSSSNFESSVAPCNSNQNLFASSMNEENEDNSSPACSQTNITDSLCPYSIFRKNIPFLYMGFINYHMLWPSLTVEFMSEMSFSTKNTRFSSVGEANFCTQKVVFGTHTSKSDTDYVCIGDLKFPLRTFKEDPLKCENYEGFTYNNKNRSINSSNRFMMNSQSNQNIPNFEIKAKLVHPGEVNRAIHMPQNPFYIATKNAYGNVLFFDYSKHPTTCSNTRICKPELLLNGHSYEGYGLSWNYNCCGLLASCCSEGRICIWNIESSFTCSKSDSSSLSTSTSSSLKNNYDMNNFLYKCEGVEGNNDTYTLELNKNVTSIEPIYNWKVDETNYKFSNDSNSVATSMFSLNDVQWLPTHKFILATACDNGCIDIWDLRQKVVPTSACKTVCAENMSAVNTISFNPYNEYVFASGNVDGYIHIYDLRNVQKKMCTLVGHTDCINRVEWSPGCSAVLASCANDGLVILWDVSKCSYNDNCNKDNTGKFLSNSSNKVNFEQSECNNANLNNNYNDEINHLKTNLEGNISTTDNAICSNYLHPNHNQNAHNKIHNNKAKKKKNIPCIRQFSSGETNMNKNNSSCEGSSLNEDPKEILFVHVGHRGAVSDFSWSKNSSTKWLISSVGEDNTLQAWQIAETMLLR